MLLGADRHSRWTDEEGDIRDILWFAPLGRGLGERI